MSVTAYEAINQDLENLALQNLEELEDIDLMNFIAALERLVGSSQHILKKRAANLNVFLHDREKTKESEA